MKNIFCVVLLLSCLIACNPISDTDKAAALSQQLIQIDSAMGGANVSSRVKAAEFIQTSEALAAILEKTNPDRYVDVVLKAAGLAKTIGQPQKSIELYKKVVEGMPQHKKAPTALFMIGFVYENDLMDLESAKKTYETFLSTYPNDPDFADDAQTAIKNLGRSPEELIKEFEQNQQQQEQ